VTEAYWAHRSGANPRRPSHDENSARYPERADVPPLRQGMPHLKGEGRGDQFERVKIVLPKNLDERSQQLLRDFERLNL
jgi:hypothetical protein